MTEVVDKETGEITEEPTTIEDMIAATMTPDEEDEEEREESEREEDGSEDGGYAEDHAHLVLTAEDAERQAQEQVEQRASVKLMEKRFKSRDTRADTYTKAMAELAAETDQPIVRCPVCLPEWPAFIFHPEVVPLNQDQLNVLNILLGNPLMPDFQAIPQARTCPACNGLGRVLTGSQVTNRTTIECLECDGSGWVGEAKNKTPQVATAPQYVQPNEDGIVPEELPKLDPWGTPDWDTDYMRMPPARPPGWDNGTGVWVHPDQRV